MSIILAVDLWLRISTDGGSTWKSGGSDYTYTGLQMRSGTTSGTGSATSSGIFIVADASSNHWSNAAAQSISGDMKLYNPANTASWKRMLISVAGLNANSTPNLCEWVGSGSYIGAATAINGIRFMMSSGNIASGTIHLYGVKKS